MSHWTPAIAGLAILLASPAVGQDRPLLRPTHDVAAVYRVQAAGPNGAPETRTMHMYWAGGGARLRMETEGEPGFAVVDFPAGRMTMVNPPEKAYAQVTFDADHAPGLNFPPGTAINRAGNQTVSGVVCTVWDVRGPQGGGTVCITGDGLLLSLQGSQPGAAPIMLAVSVVYGPQPANLFTLPPGLHQVAPP
jgi:hypothetical protein